MKILIFGLLLTFNLFANDSTVITVGSKPHTEHKILAEIIAQALETTGEVQVKRDYNKNSSGDLYEGLRNKEIHIYPEYSRDIAASLIPSQWQRFLFEVKKRAKKQGVHIAGQLGFNKVYSLAVKKDNPKFKNINKISDLKGVTGYKRAFSGDFLTAQDGFFSVAKAYGLNTGSGFRTKRMKKSRLIPAINSGKVDMIQVDSTSPDVAKHNLKLLEDTRGKKSRNLGIVLVRYDFERKYPASWKILNEVILNKIPNKEMAKMNAQVELENKSYSAVAAGFLKARGVDTTFSKWKQIYPKLLVHLQLALIPLLLSALIGMFLVRLARKNKTFENLVNSFNKVYKPIPFLIFLVILVPFLGAGQLPVYITLFVFGLFPIVKYAWENTPLAGIKYTAFTNIGIGTIAAYVGAGGLGDFIINGLSQNDKNMILMGLIPALILILLIQLIAGIFNRYMPPKGLQR
jgi:osmoprotectant transport system permease protein